MTKTAGPNPILQHLSKPIIPYVTEGVDLHPNLIAAGSLIMIGGGELAELEGGQQGLVGRQWVERADGRRENLTGTDSAELAAGDVFVIETPGGGGYGNRPDLA